MVTYDAEKTMPSLFVSRGSIVFFMLGIRKNEY